jgi:hypothetical protein
MATIQIYNPSSAGTVYSFSAPIVRIKAAWADEWLLMPYARCSQSEQVAGPGISKATFEYMYGVAFREDGTEFIQWLPAAILDWFVKISAIIEGTEVDIWTGRIVEEYRALQPRTDVSTGDQGFTAYGLEYELDRATIDGSVWHEGASYKWSDVEATFNRRVERGNSLTGNRSTNPETDHSYVFSGEGETWTAAEAVEYLLDRFGPDAPAITLAGQTELLDFTCPPMTARGSVWAAICSIINPRRGMGCALRTDGTAATLHVFSLLDEAISEGGVEIPANAEPCAFAADGDIMIEKLVIGQSSGAKVDEIIVRGEPVLTCFSLEYLDTNLEAGWSAAEETAYKEAAKNQSGYGAMDDEEKASTNDAYRGREVFRRIYSTFVPPAAWNFTAAFIHNVAPTVLDDGNIDPATPADVVRATKCFERSLPLLEGYDYTGATPIDNNPANIEPQYRRPFAVVYWDGDADGHPDGYRFAEKAGDAEEKVPGATIRMLEGQMGIEVLFRPNHTLAKGHWTGAEPTGDGSAYDVDESPYEYRNWPFYDWRTMCVTVAMRLDGRLQVRRTIGTGTRRLVVDVPGAELHYLVPDTILDVGVNGAILTAPYGGVIRDDSPTLRMVAALASAWYSKTRRSVNLSLKRQVNFAPVGSLLRVVSGVDEDVECNTVVSRVAHDWRAGTTSIETAYTELDVVGAAGVFADYPDDRAVRRALLAHERNLRALMDRTADLPARGSL